MSNKTSIEFPCDYPIKIVGKASENFDARIITIINKYQEKPFEGHLMQRDSKEKNYQSFTVTVHITSEEQLHDLVLDLKKDKDVMLVF
jgi:putative lipoic acid-binding regulatory protein